MAERTAIEMIDFLNEAIRNRKINPKTGASVRSACMRILKKVYGDPSHVDIPSLDVEGTLKEFERRERRIGVATLQSYKARLRLAVRWYLAYLKDPLTWREATVRSQPQSSLSFVPPDEGLTDYKFPIRAGVTGRLFLPAELTRAEAKRITAFVDALVLAEGETSQL